MLPSAHWPLLPGTPRFRVRTKLGGESVQGQARIEFPVSEYIVMFMQRSKWCLFFSYGAGHRLLWNREKVWIDECSSSIVARPIQLAQQATQESLLLEEIDWRSYGIWMHYWVWSGRPPSYGRSFQKQKLWPILSFCNLFTCLVFLWIWVKK